eukprot:1949855-Rhodomonas_salina.7
MDTRNKLILTRAVRATDQCNLDVQFNFCVEQDAELGFKQVVQAGSVVRIPSYHDKLCAVSTDFPLLTHDPFPPAHALFLRRHAVRHYHGRPVRPGSASVSWLWYAVYIGGADV